jgi:hypothetical protein
LPVNWALYFLSIGVYKLDWVNVADTSIKIGLGALISAISGYLVLRKTHEHEEQKEIRANFYKRQEDKKLKYIEFSSTAYSLVYHHVFTKSDFETDEYKSFLRCFNEVSIISTEELQASSSILFDTINQYIGMDKSHTSDTREELILKLRENVNTALISFQNKAMKAVTEEYKKI